MKPSAVLGVVLIVFGLALRMNTASKRLSSTSASATADRRRGFHLWWGLRRSQRRGAADHRRTQRTSHRPIECAIRWHSRKAIIA